MKSVLIGADILKLENEYKLLEINTDADLFLPDVQYLDLNPLFDYLTTNSYSKFVIIYKKKHIDNSILNLFASKCNQNSIEFSTILIMDNSVTIPSYVEEPNTFYLRCAYDVTAIIDDTYCRDKSEVAKLLFDSNNESILPKTYVKYSQDGAIIDNLTDLVDNGVSPNLIVKKILPDFDKINYPAFYNISSNSELETLKENSSDEVILQEYQINPNLSEDNQISDVIRMNVILLSDVETIIPLGISISNNQLPLDTNDITYTGNKLDNKWRAMYFSNPSLLGYGVPDNYEVIKIVDGEEQIVTINELVVGDTIKSVILPNLSLTASMQESLDWSIDSSEIQSITYSTGSVMFITKKAYEGWLSYLEYGNGTVSGSSLLSNNEILLVSSSVNQDIRFKTAYETTTSDLILTSTNNLFPVTNKENVWYSGSIVILDIEPADVFVAGTDINEITKNNVGNILIHNKCVWSGFCCFSEDTLISIDGGEKQIKDIEVGDLVWSYNLDNNTKELKSVLEIQSPMHDDIVEIELSNGVVIKATFDHPFYKADGTMVSYSPEKTTLWLNGVVSKIQLDDELIHIDGSNVVVKSIKENLNLIQTHTLFVEDNNNFFANGVLVYDEQK